MRLKSKSQLWAGGTDEGVKALEVSEVTQREGIME
jgi:hypothetical protein